MRIMYGGKNPNGSNKAVIFFNSKRFVYPVPTSSEIDLYVNTSSFAFQMIPNVLMAIPQSLNLYFLHDQLLLWSEGLLLNYAASSSHTFQLITKVLTVHDTTWSLSCHQLLNPLCCPCTLITTLNLTPSEVFVYFFGMLSGGKLCSKW